MSLRIGFVSTYQPTRCGLATFTSALLGALTASGEVKAEVLRLVTGPDLSRSDLPEVIAELDTADAGAGTELAAASLDSVDVAVVQFEYGIFGGSDGEQAISLLRNLRVPSVVVLHTVLSRPTWHQREVLEQVSALADAVVVMTETARTWLAAGYRVDPAKVVTIPHGAGGPADETSAASLPGGTRPLAAGQAAPTILTWGLIGPGKGIEWGIDAVAGLADITPRPRYVVAGQTHPKVLERDGERYRHELQRRAAARGIAGQVVLDDRYRDKAALAALVSSADVVLLPYDSREQISSGVLIEAVAAGVPVVATRFPHAIELLGSGAGLLVDQQSPDQMATALRAVLTDPGRAARMRAAAAVIGGQVSWPAVAAAYRQVTDRLAESRLMA
jgi:glycosyltransferase involved in cell wall biosynthesis